MTCTINGKIAQPIEYKVLVLPDDIEETDETIKSAKAAGIQLLDNEKEREKSKQISGSLVSAGSRAFADFGELQPKVGDSCYFAKYAGVVIKGDDGREYRLMNDKDITMVLV